MGHVAIRNESSTPIERDSEARGAGQPLSRSGQTLTLAGSATGQPRTTHAGGISLAAVLGGTLLKWGGGLHDASPRPMAVRT